MQRERSPTGTSVPALLVIVLCLWMCSACAAVQAPFSPPVETFPYSGARPADTLVFLIAGATDTPEDMREKDMLRALWAAGCACDIKVVYYTGPTYLFGTLADEMHEDVVAAAKAHDYRARIWAGISAGGMAALEMARQYPEDVDHLVLISPYLGSDLIVGEIERAGGLLAWTPAEPIEQVEKMWEFVQGYGRGGAKRPPADLMYGADDPNAPAQRLIGALLPEDQVRVIDGGHEWPIFRKLWFTYLKRQPRWLQAEPSEPG